MVDSRTSEKGDPFWSLLPSSKENNQWVVVLPDEEVERLGLDEGQEINVKITPTEADVILNEEIERIAKRIVKEHRDALEYLAR